MVKLAVCISVILVLLVALTETTPTRLCCTMTRKTEVPLRVLKSYTPHDDFCKIRAVIFTTIKNTFICGNPDDEWVKNAMQVVPRFP
ncbi:C-C motif chemokine 17 [Pholidichthys leucotaenia]